MSFGFDETALADVATLAEGRRLGEEARDRLARALAGDVSGDNRDLPLWNAAHVLLALSAYATKDPSGRRRPVDALVGYVLDPALATPSGAMRRFAGGASHGAIRVSGDVSGMKLEAGEASRSIAWSQASLSLALVEFIATADDCQRFGEVRAGLSSLCDDAGDPIAAIKIATRLLGRLLAEWRRAHFDGAEIDQEQRELLRFLERAGKGFVIDDEALLAYWRERVSRGARLTFRAAVRHAMLVEANAMERAARGAFAQPADIDDAIDIAGADQPDIALLTHESAAPRADNDDIAESDTEDEDENPVLRALNRIPASPKMLLSAERADLAQIFEIAPWHLTRPLTAMRYAALGGAQAVLVEAFRKRAAIDVNGSFSAAPDYDGLQRRWSDLKTHTETLDGAGRLAVDFEKKAAEFVKATAGFRRAGFDASAPGLARSFRKSGPELAMIAVQVRKFVEAMDRLALKATLAERFDRDKEAFAHAFSQQYRPQVDVKP